MKENKIKEKNSRTKILKSIFYYYYFFRYADTKIYNYIHYTKIYNYFQVKSKKGLQLTFST